MLGSDRISPVPGPALGSRSREAPSPASQCLSFTWRLRLTPTLDPALQGICPFPSHSAPVSGPVECSPWSPHLKLLCSEHIWPGLGQHLLTKPGLSVDVHWAQRLAGQELVVDVVGLLS